MNGFALRQGMAFDWNGTGFRIDRLQPNSDVLLERVEDGQLSVVPRDQLLTEYTQGRISARSADAGTDTISQHVFSRPLEELPEGVLRATSRRRHYLRKILEHGDIVFTAAYLKPLIRAAATEIDDPKPPSVPTIHRWYSRYRAYQDLRALIPRFDRRGPRIVRQDSRILELASEAIEEAFRASPRATGRDIYLRLVARLDIENRQRLPDEQFKRPSLRTVYRMLKRVDAFDQVMLKEGKAVADKRHRIGKTGTKVTNILERVEMDHTPLDLFLIDERTWLPLGRPTLTVALECYSRMLLGYYLSFDSPSSAAVMGALRHAILPKEPIVETISNLKVEHAWPCYGRPDVLVVDNGLEFHGLDLESVSFDLGMRIQYCPKHEPGFKGRVERYLKTINYNFAHQLPGTSFARWHERGDYDPQKHAVLTLGEFKHIFEKWVVDVYAQERHRGIGTTPWAKWHEGLGRREPELPADLRELQQRIGLVSERALRRDGIWLHGIRYSGDALQPILRAFGEGVRVRVVFDPEDLGAIQVWGPNDETPATVLAMDPSYACGLTVRQNELIRTSLREQGAAAEDRAALEHAKHQLAVAVQELMASRKQRHRRKAAALQGINSNKPAPNPMKPTVTPPPAPKKSTPPDDCADAPPVPAYPSFKFSR